MQKITLLDGGLGQEINKRSSQAKSHPLWSVQVMHNEPEIVVKAHEEFISAGAKVLTLNNYTATPTRMTRHDMGDYFESTHKLAIDLLNQAITNTKVTRADINIAGCLPPIAASYIAAEALSYQESFDEYSKIIAAQAQGVDLFLVETMSNISEAEAAIDALYAHGQKAYIGFTLTDDKVATLRSGEPLADALAMLQDKQVSAVLINCSFPETVTQALPQLNDSKLTFGAYANGFTAIDKLTKGGTVDVLEARVDLSKEVYAKHVKEWIDGGATIVGGCCEISPQHIDYLHQSLLAEGYRLDKLC
jgi:homocysteine S-methyltransferase